MKTMCARSTTHSILTITFLLDNANTIFIQFIFVLAPVHLIVVKNVTFHFEPWYFSDFIDMFEIKSIIMSTYSYQINCILYKSVKRNAQKQYLRLIWFFKQLIYCFVLLFSIPNWAFVWQEWCSITSLLIKLWTVTKIL